MHMSSIRDIADECTVSSKKIDSYFWDWMVFMGDLHASCEESSTDIGEELLSLDTKIKARKIFEEQEEEAVKISSAALDAFEKNMDRTMQMYQEAVDKIPTGYASHPQLVIQDFDH